MIPYHPVRVVALGSGYCVAVTSGRYHEVLTLEEAITRAYRKAAAMRQTEIGVYDTHGKLVRTMHVPQKGLPYRLDHPCPAGSI